MSKPAQGRGKAHWGGARRINAADDLDVEKERLAIFRALSSIRSRVSAPPPSLRRGEAAQRAASVAVMKGGADKISDEGVAKA